MAYPNDKTHEPIDVQSLSNGFTDKGIIYYHVYALTHDFKNHCFDVFSNTWIHYETRQPAKLLILDEHAVGYQYEDRRYYGLKSEFFTFFRLLIPKDFAEQHRRVT